MPYTTKIGKADATNSSGTREDRIIGILREAKKLAHEYRNLTGKLLGITGEVAEYEAARLLGVELTPARQAGYDAIEQAAGVTRRLQIKGRCSIARLQAGPAAGFHRYHEGLGSGADGCFG